MKKIYLFVEGNDDELFFKSVVVPLLNKLYAEVEIIQFAQMKRSKVELFILSINTLKFDYLLFADIDFQRSVNQKKKVIQTRFSNIEEEKIFIVIKEIESWYIAGLNNSFSREFGIKPLKNTNELVKEEFNLFYHGKFRSRIDFMLEILKDYSVKTAVEKNESFKYFYDQVLI